MGSVPAVRREQIAAGLAAARERIRQAESNAGRPAGSVSLTVVTKTFPAEEVAVLAELGVRDVGENRDQEAAPKAQALESHDLVWHYIGQLQSNKARSVVGYAEIVESVDRPKLVGALSRAAEAAGRTLACLVQVSLEPGSDAGPGRGGVDPSGLSALADAVAESPALDLRGVMAVAPLGEDPDQAFSRLAELADRLRQGHPQASAISAGMSADLEAAVRHGATHVRLGSAILGYRPPVG